jgi:hypothetical protein
MKKRKPYFTPGSLVKIADPGSNYSWKLMDKLALVIKVYPDGHEEIRGKDIVYDVQILDCKPEDGFLHPNGWSCSKFIDGNYDKLRINQWQLRKLKVKKKLDK